MAPVRVRDLERRGFDPVLFHGAWFYLARRRSRGLEEGVDQRQLGGRVDGLRERLDAYSMALWEKMTGSWGTRPIFERDAR